MLDAVVKDVDGDSHSVFALIEAKGRKEVFDAVIFYLPEVLVDSLISVVLLEGLVDLIEGDHCFDC